MPSSQIIQEHNLTHSKTQNLTLENIVQKLRDKIIERSHLPHATIQFQLEILARLKEFPFGRFIIERRGANGFWTDYLISHPQQGKLSGLNSEGKPFNFVEDFLLNECPVVLAHQERFKIYQGLTQALLKDNMVIASIPCGLMRDLLTLDLSSFNNVELVGIDIDTESLTLAQQLAYERNIKQVKFLQMDAWEMGFKEEFDIINSSGLNVYESDPQKVLKLYQQFYQALKPGGVLITSVLTYPPGTDKPTDWNLNKISPQALLLDQILHKDILDIKWRNFRCSHELGIEFKHAGFSAISIYFDECHIFPTVLVRK